MIGDKPTTQIDLMAARDKLLKADRGQQKREAMELTHDQLMQITDAVKAGIPNGHICQFSESDRSNIHDLCGVLRNGGLEAIREMIELSKQISASKRIAGYMIITAIIGGCIAVVVTGLRVTFGIKP